MIRVRSYAQLIRLPNVFTALADIALAAFAAGRWGEVPDTWPFCFACLLGASACLYSAGMVWNDIFDVAQDRRERPYRPLPSGRVSRRSALACGIGLMGAGLLLAAGAGWTGFEWQPKPIGVAGILTLTILLYDGWLKCTLAGPIAMGACRFLNVLLGLTLGSVIGEAWAIHLAVVVGLYIIGVTWFARTEARTSRPLLLLLAAGVMLTALVLALALPIWFPSDSTSPLYPYLLVLLGFLVGLPIMNAIEKPVPERVQAAVKRAIMGLVVLDATLATGLVGWQGLAILLLLLPALYLGRWLYST
jgi:4-hydroxybenzoate polyprenyltransferase